MPDLVPLDPKERSTITTLPTYPLNEGEISDMIDIHYNIRDDIGLSPEQVQNNVLNYKGDLMTVQNDRFALHCECNADEYRRAVFRQSCCSPEEQLGFVEATAGLFHTEIHALNIRLGKVSRASSALLTRLGTESYRAEIPKLGTEPS